MPNDDNVYVLKSCGLIKVGTSTRVKHRLHELRQMNAAPIELFECFSGGRPLENRLHKRLVHLRHHGEWFEDCSEAHSIIAAVRREEPAVKREEAAVVKEEKAREMKWRLSIDTARGLKYIEREMRQVDGIQS